MKKILPFLLLNVFVSALTMLGVILIWNAFHPSVTSKTNLDNLLLDPTQTSAAPLPPLDDKIIEIQSVFLPGEAQYEKISLKNVSDEPVDLTGWKLVNAKEDDFVFPALTLYPEGAIDIYTHTGINTAVELFWNQTTPCWQSGESAVLLDSAGNQRSSYLIP